MTEKEKELLCRKLGINIKSARLKAGFTQVNFAKLLDLSRPSIVNIENGRQLPPLNILYDIAKVLDIDVESILKNLSVSNINSELEEDSKKLLESWKKSAPETHSNDTISTVEEFLKDTNQIQNE